MSSKDRFPRVLPLSSICLPLHLCPGLTFKHRGTKETVLSAIRILSLPWLSSGQTDRADDKWGRVVWLLAAPNDTCFGDHGFEPRGSFAQLLGQQPLHTEGCRN